MTPLAQFYHSLDDTPVHLAVHPEVQDEITEADFRDEERRIAAGFGDWLDADCPWCGQATAHNTRRCLPPLRLAA